MVPSKFLRQKSFTPFNQAIMVCSLYEGFTYKVLGLNSVLIRGSLRPSDLLPAYSIEITYQLGKSHITYYSKKCATYIW
jgi:hypothetical protein